MPLYHCDNKSGVTDKQATHFISNQRAAVTIEFAFMLLLLCLFIAFMADIFIARSTIGKLDRTSYSLLNIVKERKLSSTTQSDTLSQEEVNKLAKIANSLLFNDPDDERAMVSVDFISFQDETQNPQSLNNRIPVVVQAQPQLSAPSINKSCQPNSPDSLKTMAPLSELNRFVPLVRVTVCIPHASSLFLTLYSFFQPQSRTSGSLFRSSSVGVIRESYYSDQLNSL